MPVGGCVCGSVRYEVAGESEATVLCHCLDCRKIGGSTYSSNSIFSDNGFKVTQGAPKEFTKTADSGKSITSKFCGDCGSTMWREGESFPGKVLIKAGTLDDPNILNSYKVEVELFAPTRPNWVGAQDGATQVNTMS